MCFNEKSLVAIYNSIQRTRHVSKIELVKGNERIRVSAKFNVVRNAVIIINKIFAQNHHDYCNKTLYKLLPTSKSTMTKIINRQYEISNLLNDNAL